MRSGKRHNMDADRAQSNPFGSRTALSELIARKHDGCCYFPDFRIVLRVIKPAIQLHQQD